MVYVCLSLCGCTLNIAISVSLYLYVYLSKIYICVCVKLKFGTPIQRKLQDIIKCYTLNVSIFMLGVK